MALYQQMADLVNKLAQAEATRDAAQAEATRRTFWVRDLCLAIEGLRNANGCWCSWPGIKVGDGEELLPEHSPECQNTLLLMNDADIVDAYTLTQERVTDLERQATELRKELQAARQLALKVGHKLATGTLENQKLLKAAYLEGYVAGKDGDPLPEAWELSEAKQNAV